MERLRTTYFAGEGARRRLFILDSCYSGDFYGPDYRSSADSPDPVQRYIKDKLMLDSHSTGRVAISSCLPYQRARDNPSMTTYLLRALRGEEPAAARNTGEITVNSLFDYLTIVMPADQRPVLSGVQHDTFVLYKYAHLARPDPDNGPPPPDDHARATYLAHLINTHRVLRLPDNSQAELERLYVALKADRMNAAERDAEHRLYLEQVAALQQQIDSLAPDKYTAADRLVRALVRNPWMQLLQPGSRKLLFGPPPDTLRSLAEVVQDHPTVVILGDPGAGKTTLGRWLVLHYARALKDGHERVQVRADHVRPGAAPDLLDLDRARLPIYVRIADYARARWPADNDYNDTHLTLAAFIAQGSYHHSNDLCSAGLTAARVGAMARAALEQRQALVVLDGLDEVADLTQRRAVMHTIRQAIDDWDTRAAGGNRLVLTSRIIGYQFQPLTDLPHYTIEPLDDTAIRAFCQAWMQQMATTNAAATPEQAEQLFKAITEQAHPGVRRLAGNPLLLTILAQVYWQSDPHRLPTSRIDLFDQAAQALYRQRETFWRMAGISARQLTRALAAVAADLHTATVNVLAEERRVRARLHTVLANRDQVDRVLRAAREVAGFLVELGGGVYGFLHRALQEYFAAHYLVDEDAPVACRLERLAQHVLDPTWREPLVLAVARVSQDDYPDDGDFLPAVFATLLDTPDPAGSVLPRRELLAAAASAECQRRPSGIVERITARLLAGAVPRGEQPLARPLQQRIVSALQALYDSDPAEALAAMSAALQHPDLAQRQAALDLLLELQRAAPALVAALLSAWTTYPDPAATLLLALERLHAWHPAWFTDAQLPLRQAFTQEPQLWARACASPAWQQVIRWLYMRTGAAFDPAAICRDSPLTAAVLAALRQADPEAALRDLCEQWLPCARQPGTAKARDAALLLSAAGDTRWIDAAVAQSDAQGTALRPVVAFLDLSLARDPDLSLAVSLARDPDLALSLARDPDLALAREKIKTIADTIDHARRRWQDDPAILDALDAADRHCQHLTALLVTDTSATAILAQLAAAWAARCAPSASAADADAPPTPTLSLDTLPALVAALSSADDQQRAQARAVLLTERPASMCGMELIDHLAWQCHTADDYQVATQLSCALGRIEHDQAEWLQDWIAQATASNDWTAARTILSHIHRITPAAYAVLLQALRQDMPPAAPGRAQPGGQATLLALLDSLSWLARLGQVPAAQASASLELLSNWLATERDTDLRLALIEVLGHWRADRRAAGQALFDHLAHATGDAECATYFSALARCATYVPELHDQVHTLLAAAQPGAAPALVRLLLAQARRDHPSQQQETVSAALLELLAAHLSDPQLRLTALLDAGVDDDLWDEDYHERLVRAARQQLQALADTNNNEALAALGALVTRLHAALAWQGWPERRIALAALAAAAEALPTSLQQAARQTLPPPHTLEQLLVQGALDAESYNSRRFALTALSYLRTVTPAIVPALLAGCRDNVEIVQQDTIATAGRFQTLAGNPLPELVPALTGASVSTAWVVAQVLGALGTAASGAAAGLRDQIITALVDALNDSGSAREVLLFGENGESESKGVLADTLYTELLRVAGWPG